MKTSIISFIVVLSLLMSGCKKETDTDPGDNKTDFTVSGILKTNGKPIENAIVDIDGLEQYKVTTNSEGYFLIEDVFAGNHTLNTKQSYNNGVYIQKSYSIALQKNLNLESLLLPNPVSIKSITLDSTTNIATIIWNKSLADDFREYKLYSHSSTGLDETTGTLEHVTIDVNDTIKTIQLKNSTQNYFRVFVLNETGQLGGSNIMDVVSVNMNLAAGGAFDDANDLAYWDLSGDVFIDNDIFHDGTGSVLLKSTIDTVDNNIIGSVDRWPVSTNEMSLNIDLEADKDYTISFWYKLSGFGYMMYPFKFYYYQNNENKLETTIYDYNWPGTWIPQSPFKILDDTGWLYYSKTFNSDSDADAVFHIECQMENAWIDNLEIKVVE